MQKYWFQSRWAGSTVILALAWYLPLQPVSARYMMPDLVNVPVDRLIKNLELLVTNEPANVEARFNLARAHAMAYAQRVETVQVLKGKENQGVWFGFHPQHVPFTVEPSDDNAKLKTAQAHLAQAVKRYAEVVELDPNNLSAAIGYAWCLEQSVQKQQAINRYRKVIAAAWENEKDLKQPGLGWQSITAEAAGYLIPLLDKDADRREINTLQERVKRMEMEMALRPITPLVIPLKENLTARSLEDHSASVAFDADGTGSRKRWTWISRGAGWLVYDPHCTGKVTSALQFFGSVSFWMFWENGYHALASLDDDCDGTLAGNELEGLAIWRDINSNGICEPGEVKPLSEWGIVALSCKYVRDLQRPDHIAYSPQGVFFRDGSHRSTYDVILHPAITTVD